MDRAPMQQAQPRKIIRINQGRREQVERQVVEEYPLRLRVNGQDLLTLVCSSHGLNFLVAGFLRLQGFIDSLDDIRSLGVCADFGLAEVRLGKPLPERLQPALTSGCGTGISYGLPQSLLAPSEIPGRSYDVSSLMELMRQLQQRAELYRSHGGIHSAAVGDGRNLLYAEDIGRHNTLDRLAGEALFRGIDLRRMMLVSSGRVSTEMVAKAARLGLGLIASRTSPTDKAIELCDQAGIALVGYLRGTSMEIYSHSEQLQGS